MQDAAQLLLGEHDFSAFRAADCQARHATRELQHIGITRQGDWVSVDVRANAFLQHMVRNIVGTLAAVGKGEQPAQWVADVLSSRDRKRAGITAPAQGLTLVAVDYPGDFALPRPPASTLLPGVER